MTEEMQSFTGGKDVYKRQRLSKETFYPVMILDTPYQVTGQFTVKEPHGQPHQLGEEIRDERHVDTRTDVEQYATPDYLCLLYTSRCV